MFVSPLAPSLAPAALGSTEAILKRNNVRLLGKGQPLVLCNGFGCNQRIWHYMLSGLAARYQVVLFDHVGSGGSVKGAYDPEKYSSLDGYAQDLVEVCRALDLHDAILVGHSVGATIAMLAAIDAPAHFAKVVLLTPSPCYLNEPPSYYGGFEREDLQQVLSTMEDDYRSWTNVFADMLLGPANSGSLGEELANLFCEMDSGIALDFARVTFFSDNRADVPRLQLPTLVLQCTDDAVGPEEVGEFLLKNLPNGQLVKLKATGHCPHLSAPIETMQAIQAFVR